MKYIFILCVLHLDPAIGCCSVNSVREPEILPPLMPAREARGGASLKWQCNSYQYPEWLPFRSGWPLVWAGGMERNGMHQGGATQGQGQQVQLLQHGLWLCPLRPLLLQVMSVVTIYTSYPYWNTDNTLPQLRMVSDCPEAGGGNTAHHRAGVLETTKLTSPKTPISNP